MTEAQRESHNTIEVKSLDSLKLLNDLVLCKRAKHNVDSITESGIIKTVEATNKDQFLYNNADRMVEIIKPPVMLTGDRWGTEIEIQEGDIAWISYLDAINCPALSYKDEDYWIVNYKDLRVAKRGDQIIPLNGYIICREIKREHKYLSHTVENVDKYYGEVLYVGKKNKSYPVPRMQGNEVVIDNKDLDGNQDVNVGDIIYKSMGESNHILLEDPYFTYFPEPNVFVLQRRHVDAIVNP